ncbi:hypothetical protein [Methanoculleus sp.]|uniref:hypothetical protein n=1 Tax=Methanoculleus sp. TaxID=90427 RepID=UPI001BD4BCFA|nr:hypothetical protein [Methanoculleus sp.]
MISFAQVIARGSVASQMKRKETAGSPMASMLSRSPSSLPLNIMAIPLLATVMPRYSSALASQPAIQ